MKQKIAILHDAFLYRGGGERLVTLMAKSLHADLYSGFFSKGSFDPRELGFSGNMFDLGRPVFQKGWRHLVLKFRFFFRAKSLNNYDVVIFSGDCLGALRHIPLETKKIYYCHTPPRYLFDFRERYLQKFPFFIRPFAHVLFSFLGWIYREQLRDFDQIITNSHTVAARLKKFTGFDSITVYPPTDTTFFSPNELHDHRIPFGQKEYFFSFARLSPPKRVEHIVRVFLEMPEKNLILTYGKNDPLRSKILSLIEGAPNIRALEAPDDILLLSLIRSALATIYIPVDEDFGMSPVESMACGTPVIGVNEGGLRETIIDGVTGILLPSDEARLESRLQKCLAETPCDFWLTSAPHCRERAQAFSLEKFTHSLTEIIHAA